MRLLLAGASPEIWALARSLGHEVIAVADPNLAGKCWHGLPVERDDLHALQTYRPEAVALAIDEPEARHRVQDAFESEGVSVISLIGGYKAQDAVTGHGLVVQRLAHLSEQCHVGRGGRLNVGANIMHNCTLGDFVTIAPNAVLLGYVEVGDHGYIGANATVLPNRKIGARCMVGAGAVVTNDVPDGATVMGNPAR